MQQFRYREKRSPKNLMEAAAWRDLKAVQGFLQKGARLDQQDASGWTALHHAVGYGELSGIDVPTDVPSSTAVVAALLKAGAPLNVRDKGGMTPLMQAVAARHEDVARLLVEAGADLRPVDAVGGSALTHALWYEHGSRAFATYLVQKGAPVNLWDALCLGDTAKAQALAATVEGNAKGPRGFTPLHLAAMLGNRDVASVLLQRHASPSALTEKRQTPLHLAIGGEPGNVIPSGRLYWHQYGPTVGRTPLLMLLLSSHAPRDARDNDGYSALACAVLAERPELVHFLIKTGANPNGKGFQDEPLLVQALQQRSAPMVKALLADGASPKVKTTYGTTALEYAKGELALYRILKTALKTRKP